LDKEEIINRDENSITFEQKGKANEIRKEELYEKYKEYYKNNKSIISENFLVTLFSIEKCGNCQNEICKFQSQYFLKFNKDDIENERGEIKNIFLNYNDNISNTKVKKCDACEENKAMELSIQFYKLSKYLLIFIEHGFESSKVDMKNLDKLEIGKEEVISLDDGDKYEYKLVSFIAREKGAYDYYNRKKNENEFTKNDEEKIVGKESTYSLETISGNIIALYYYCEELGEENININNLPPTNPTSVNGDNQSLNGQNISFTSNIIFGNFNNENPNINGIHFQNNVQVGFNNNLN
jgi:ubiquitin C-terminal hydrolase